ncbi:MAG: LGFP repeat-containing protein [Mycobacterium sp.]
MNTKLARAAAAVGGVAIAAAFAVSCSATKDATKDAMSSASSMGSSAASAAGSAVSSGASAASSGASAAGSAASSAASVAGSAASSGASVASSAASSGASAASSVVSSVLNGAPTTMNVPGVGDVSLDGPTAEAYQKMGGEATLGAPTAMPEKVGDGTVQAFKNGTIFAYPGGAYMVQGEILRVYNEQGGPGGALGWPTADETETGGGAKQSGGGWISEFQNGTITWLNDGKGNFTETITKK